MKKLLFLLLITAVSYGQTYQNPTFGTVTTKTSPTVTNDPYVATTGATGIQGKIAPVNVIIPHTPVNYTVPNLTIGSHLAGIDTRLGQISSTTAGLTQRIYFTADNTTVNSVVYFASNSTGKGATAAGSPPALVLADNTKGYFTKDLISIPQPAPTIGYAGSYSGNLTVSATPTPVATRQRFTVEVYRTNNLGTPIASGVSGAPVGDLGVTVIAVLDSGELNINAGAITNVSITGILTQNITINTGERLRYHVSAAKIGAGGGNVTFGVYYGSSYNSYYDVPVAITTDAVVNKSTVVGVTDTDALNVLNGGLVYKKTIAQIRALTGTLPSNNFYTTDIGQEGNWYYDSTDVTSTDNTGTILVTSDGKRIKRMLVNKTINPVWFGCVGDGIADDSVNFLKTINAIQNGYTLNLSGLKYIVGQSYVITSKNNITVENGELIGKNTDITGYCMSFVSCNFVNVKNVIFNSKNSLVSGQQLTGIRITTCNDVTITNVNFYDCFYGVFANSTNNRILLNKCSMEGLVDYSVSNESNYLISRAMFYIFGTTFDSGVTNSYGKKLAHFILSENTGSDNIYANFNSIYNTFDSAIYFYNTNATAIGNKIYYAGKDGIKSNSVTATGSKFTNNYIYGAGVIKSDGGILAFSLAPDAIISGNMFYLLPQSQRVATSTSAAVIRNSNQTISNNIITNLGTGESNITGVSLASDIVNDVVNTSISGNTFIGCSDGVKINQPTSFSFNGITVSNNIFSNNARAVFAFLADETYTKLKKIVIKDNILKGYSDSGFVLYMIEDLTIQGNISYDGTTYFFKNYSNHKLKFTDNITDGVETTFRININVNAQFPTYYNLYQNYKGTISQDPSSSMVSYSTAGRPNANTLNVGASVWNTTTNSINYSDGTNWTEYANLISPTFTGDPKAPTATAGDNDTSIATTAFVQNAIGTSAGFSSTGVAGTNVTSLSLFDATYIKIGNIVTVTIGVQFTATSASVASSFTASLPFNRSISSTRRIGVGSFSNSTTYNLATCQSNSTTTTDVTFFPTASGVYVGSISFQYNVNN